MTTKRVRTQRSVRIRVRDKNNPDTCDHENVDMTLLSSGDYMEIAWRCRECLAAMTPSKFERLKKDEPVVIGPRLTASLGDE